MKTQFFTVFTLAALTLGSVHSQAKVNFDKNGKVDCTPLKEVMVSLDRLALRELVLKADSDTDILLTNCVFPKIRKSGKKYDIIRAATFFDTAEDRKAFIKEARSLEKKGSYELDNKFRSTLNPNPPTEVPDGFLLIREFLGRGKYSWVSLVQDLQTGKFYAWKRSTGTKADRGDAFRKHVNLHRLWQAAKLTSADMILLQGKNGEESILHEFVGGKTFKRLYLETNFLSNLNAPASIALADMVEKMVVNRLAFLDLNAKNFIYNGSSWEIIDSQRPEILDSPAETFARGRVLWLEKWTNSSNTPEARTDVENFFADFEKNRLPALLKRTLPDSKVIQLAEQVLVNHNNSQVIPSVKTQNCSTILLSGAK